MSPKDLMSFPHDDLVLLGYNLRQSDLKMILYRKKNAVPVLIIYCATKSQTTEWIVQYYSVKGCYINHLEKLRAISPRSGMMKTAVSILV